MRVMSRGWAAAAVAAGMSVLSAGVAKVNFTFPVSCVSNEESVTSRQSYVNEEDASDIEIVNWSATHACRPATYMEPHSLEEVTALLCDAHRKGTKLRVVGSAISPNGLGLSDEGMLSMVNCNRIRWVDPDTKQICVEAGARVSDVVEHLRPYGLTLQNFASIREQQIGGFIQTGAHGTGAAIPPVDDQVVAFTLITPACGVLKVSADENSELFELARVGLGALGVMGEITLQCVDAHVLQERTIVLTRAQIREQHAERLRNNQHVRYMWIPYEDAVVVVECNPIIIDDCEKKTSQRVTCFEANNIKVNGQTGEQQTSSDQIGHGNRNIQNQHALQPMKNLLLDLRPKMNKSLLENMNFADLRDAILSVSPRGM